MTNPGKYCVKTSEGPFLHFPDTGKGTWGYLHTPDTGKGTWGYLHTPGTGQDAKDEE